MMTPLEARLTEEVAALRTQLEAVTLENRLLREKIDLLIRRIFGKSSEQINDNQLMLLLQGGDDGAKKDPASSASPGALEAEIKERGKDSRPVKLRKEREARVPEHLPAVDEVIEPAEVTAAPEAWRHIGEEVTEQLDYQPARFLRRRIIRKKYVKRDEPHLAPHHRRAQHLAGAQHGSTGTARTDHRGKVLRSSAALPAGADLRHPARHPYPTAETTVSKEGTAKSPFEGGCAAIVGLLPSRLLRGVWMIERML
jgi:hypothetical protein